MSEEAVILNEGNTFGIIKNAVVSLDSTTTIARPSFVIDKNTVGKKLLLWGEDNDFPQKVIADVRKNPELGTLLNKQASLLYSGGLEWGILKKVNGKETLEALPEAQDIEVAEWCRKTNINRYLLEASKDIYWFYNAFPEIILSLDRKKIVQICVQAAEECRFEVQNSKGVIENVYINAQWDDGAKETDTFTKKLPVIDPYYDPAGNLLADTRGLNYIYPLNYANPGNKFYQLPDWNSIRESGWLAVSALLPKHKEALLKNQSTIKYHIQIASQYWETKYKDWGKKTEPQKKTAMQTELAEIQALISGAEKAGTNFWSVFITDINQGKTVDMIKITALDDKIKSGQYLEEGKDASSYTMSAVGLHPALIGTQQSSGLSGAGSNIREAYNLHMLSNKSFGDLVLEPLNMVAIPFNGWDPRMIFRFKNSFMTTLDTNTETSEKPQTQTKQA